MEYMHETAGKLRERLGREPTADEIKAERDRLIRLAYSDMAMSASMFEDEAKERLREKARGQPPVRTDAALTLKPAQPSGEWIGESYDVLADGVVIGRIVKSIGEAVGPKPWTWAIEYYIEDHTPAHGTEPTREAAFGAFGRWWRRE